MKKCYICFGETKKPLLASLHHFMLVDFSQFEYIKGTYKIFGLRSVLTLISPFLNTVLNFKHLRDRLIIPGQE